MTKKAKFNKMIRKIKHSIIYKFILFILLKIIKAFGWKSTPRAATIYFKGWNNRKEIISKKDIKRFTLWLNTKDSYNFCHIENNEFKVLDRNEISFVIYDNPCGWDDWGSIKYCTF